MTQTDQANFNYYIANVFDIVTGGLIGSGNIIVDGTNYLAGSNSLPNPFAVGEDDGGATPGGNSLPKAYLRYIFVPGDFDFSRATSDKIQVSEAARASDIYSPHELLQMDFEAPTAGHILVYLVNENEVVNEEVFFDDFKVVHEMSPIVQMQDFYPFGLMFNSYKRESSVSQQYLYNGKELHEELNIGWTAYGARTYMSDIGRWGVIDPMSEKFVSGSPYCYVNDNPVWFIDPNGMESEDYVQKDDDRETGRRYWEEPGQWGVDIYYAPLDRGSETTIAGAWGPIGEFGDLFPELRWKRARRGTISFTYNFDYDSDLPYPPTRSDELGRTLIDRVNSTFVKNATGGFDLNIHLTVKTNKVFLGSIFALRHPGLYMEVLAHELGHGQQLEQAFNDINAVYLMNNVPVTSQEVLSTVFQSILNLADIQMRRYGDIERDANLRSIQFLPPGYQMQYNNGKTKIKW